MLSFLSFRFSYRHFPLEKLYCIQFIQYTFLTHLRTNIIKRFIQGKKTSNLLQWLFKFTTQFTFNTNYVNRPPISTPPMHRCSSLYNSYLSASICLYWNCQVNFLLPIHEFPFADIYSVALIGMTLCPGRNK